MITSQLVGEASSLEIEEALRDLKLENARLREALKLAEQNEGATTERYELTLGNARVGTWDADLLNQRTHWNSSHEILLGYEPGKPERDFEDFMSRLHPDDKARVLETLGSAITNHQEYEAEFRVCHPNGTTRWLLARGKAVYDSSGQPVRIVGTLIDIDERVTAELLRREVQKKVEKLQSIAAALSKAMTPMEVAEILIRESLLAVGGVAGSVFHLSDDGKHLELLHSSGYSSQAMAPWSKVPIETKIPLTDAVRDREGIFIGSPSEFLSRYPHFRTTVNGLSNKGWVAVPLVVGEKVFGVMGVSFAEALELGADFRKFLHALADQGAQALERTRLFENEKLARQEAQAASQAKSRFLANMSHEIRTPLGAILGFTELMKDPSQSAEERLECVETILRNGEQLSKVLNDILDLSKIESERLEIEKLDFNLPEVVQSVTSLLGLQAQEKGLAINVVVEGSVPARINSDPTRLRQVLINLVGNAIKFADHGGVEVRIRELARAENGSTGRLEFLVRDTGIGISVEQATRLFQPFTQADSSTTRKFGGTGLGLVVARDLVRALGGDLVLKDSRPGFGSTFCFTIDTGATRGESYELANLQSSSSNASPEAKPDQQAKALHGIRVLLVEDAPDNRALVGRFLKAAGAEIDFATDGVEGVSAALAGGHDLVLMDIQMPQMDGFEAVKLLRDAKYAKPIIALTAHAMKGDRERCLAAGFNDHLVKPIDRAALVKAVQAYGCH